MSRLLRSKVSIPHRPVHAIARPRITGLLEGVRGARLVLVSAPPGFGKTTALVDWLAASGMPCAWLSVDEADNDPVRFLSYLWAAVIAADGDAGDELPGTPRIGRERPLELIDELVSHLAARPDPSLIVIDDYHLVESGEVQRAIARLLDHLPPQAHLAIATRADPRLALGRLRARGELLEIRAGDLRFSPSEARQLLVERLELALADDEVDVLVARTEGWPAALQLAGRSLVGRADAGVVVRSFAGTHRFVLDFVTEEILEHLEPAVTSFLLQTSVLDRLTGPLCDALTGGSDGQAMLERLERANLPLVPLDDDRRWYRYHRLLADLLRARLAATAPGSLPALHLAAASWYEAHGFARDAIEHVLRSGDVPGARRVLARYSKDFVHAAEFATLRGWLDRLPPDVVRQDAQLSTTYAWTIALAGGTDGVADRLADAEAARLHAWDGPGEPRPDAVPTQVAGVRSVMARLGGDPSAAVRHAEDAVRLVPDGLSPSAAALLRGDALALLGHALFEAGDPERAIDAYRAARPLLLQVGNHLGVADITRNVARLEARRGRLRAALLACDAMLAETATAGVADDPALAPVHLARAEVLDRLHDPGARDAAAHAVVLATVGGDVVTLREARSLRARTDARHAARDAGAPRTNDRLVEPLTERELEVLRLVATGRSNRQVAAELHLALGTVKAHVHAISGKLGAANRAEAAARAREAGLLA